MSYKRKARRRRRGRGKRVAGRRWPAVSAGEARAIAFGAAPVYYTRGEAKFFDTDLDAVFGTMATNMELANLNIIPQNNTESGRIGRKVVLTRVDIKGIMTLPSTATIANSTSTVRLLLVCDKQTNGAAFVATDIWDTDVIGSFNNLANSTRFRVLKSKLFEFKAYGVSHTTGDVVLTTEDEQAFAFNVNLNLPIEFDNSLATGVVSTQRSNSLWLVSQSSTGVVTMTEATARIRFKDG